MKPHLPARYHKGDHLFDRTLFEASLERVEAFIATYPNSRRIQWTAIGLDPSTLYSEKDEPPTTTVSLPSSPVEQVFTPADTEAYGVPGFLAPHQTSLTKLDVIYIAAQSTVRVLHHLGLPCAIFGSLACKLYGNARTPNDVDILVLPGTLCLTQEDLKLLIVRADPHNYILRDAKDPEATYRVLHYRRNIFGPARMYQVTTKIDLVLPGTMHFPVLPLSSIAWNGDLPVIPYSLLLLHKLQAWDDHLKATECRYTRKVPADVGDLEWLLSPGRFMDYLKMTIPWRDRTIFTEEFVMLSVERVKDFCFAFPPYSVHWSEIGFETA
ncbi:hypothetical protein BDZ94DRAFT_1168535 [Collybia nuda]|uniref:Uncharacterized protein n=1 Tax=Collybia nuda TaxID=64659 RepID=A0A9P5Y2C8_9AGAR|nr:hypothetical protein BDZ94DRAFT_1168535 [Collybia nuda]